MTKLLLDYPWTLEAALGPAPEPQSVILAFLNLLARTGLDAVPFIEDEEYIEFCNGSHGRKGQNRFTALWRFLPHCRRNVGGLCRAAPVLEPPDLRESWKRALRDELINPTNWRTPQIIVPNLRRANWPPEDEVDLNCEQCEDDPASGLYQRVLAVLEQYKSHPFAVPDLDPWRHLERLWPPELGARIDHPCWLPRPPILDKVPIEQLAVRLEDARRQGWQVNGKYYFIPPAVWRPDQIAKPKWRSGDVFVCENIHGWIGPCPIDYGGLTWRWDMNERHWDVQLVPRLRITHDGRKL